MNKPQIYLDTCSIQRPFDDRSQPRIYVEAEAVLAIIRWVETGHVQLLSSDVLQFEVSRIINTHRKSDAEAILRLAGRVAPIDESTRILGEKIIATGIKPFDALHAAVAIENNAGYFCTCDDKLLKMLKRLTIACSTQFLSPLELILEITA